MLEVYLITRLTALNDWVDSLVEDDVDSKG